MGFDIWNDSKRKVVCIRNDADGMMVSSENHHLLKVGKKYTVIKVEVHTWHTLIWLKEFPGKSFNSVVFDEIKQKRKEKHFHCYKNWFVFPFCITLHTNCMEYYPPAKRLEIHFLWWHWKWTFEQEEKK